MCGIAGIVSKQGKWSPAQLAAIAEDMAGRMVYRGPDGAGLWVDPDGRCALSHRRLAIIDLSPGGAQPMASADGQQVLTYNGEFYNFLEVKPQLENAGFVFHSRSDTELILASVIFGEKPLYYVDATDYFAFASEVQALQDRPGLVPAIDRETIAAY